jgi:hypothetical protein
MDRHTLHPLAQALADACEPLRALFQEVHDLGNVRPPYARFQARMDLFDGWTYTEVPYRAPSVHVVWPGVGQGTSHRKMLVAGTQRRWEAAGVDALVQTVVQRANALLEATFPKGVPGDADPDQTCGIDVHLGVFPTCYVGWSSSLSQTASFGLEGYGLALPGDVDTIVDALLLARHLAHQPPLVDAARWTVQSLVDTQPQREPAKDTQTLHAVDAADALARAALGGANALLSATRLRAIDVWQQHTLDANTLLDTLRTRATACTPKTPSTPT